jgi:hypothetical protein
MGSNPNRPLTRVWRQAGFSNDFGSEMSCASHERLLPRTPETTGEYPEDFVKRPHTRSGILALQHSQLLPESEIFHDQASMRLQVRRCRGLRGQGLGEQPSAHCLP